MGVHANDNFHELTNRLRLESVAQLVLNDVPVLVFVEFRWHLNLYSNLGAAHRGYISDEYFFGNIELISLARVNQVSI